MRYAEAIITARMLYAETFDPFVLEIFLKYACTKALLHMPKSKKGRITREIQKSIALAGSGVFAEKMASR